MDGGNHNGLTRDRNRSNRLVAGVCVAVFVGMVGLSYASVPLYQLFCQVTGYGGTTRVATDTLGPASEKTITVSFDANVADGFGWEFKPKQRSLTLRLGEKKTAYYVARNPYGRRSTGTAGFNVSPFAAGQYFNKIECFCFTEQTLQGGEQVDMPVVFFVDPEMLDDPLLQHTDTITLSYTLYEAEETKKPLALGVDDPASGSARQEPVAQAKL
jgi:cytochrome c oxidase assembly protein subunit 11